MSNDLLTIAVVLLVVLVALIAGMIVGIERWVQRIYDRQERLNRHHLGMIVTVAKTVGFDGSDFDAFREREAGRE